MNNTAETFSALLRAHRSIRAFEPREIDPVLLDRVLEESLAGSSSSGNLNMVSVVRTRDPERKRRLHELHFRSPWCCRPRWC
jgi:nitroreductase